MGLYIVYIQIDKDYNIVKITSSKNTMDKTWIAIDRGCGIKYYSAFDLYLEKGLVDKNGAYNYKYMDGIIIERTLEDKQPELQKIIYRKELMMLKNKLAETDYITIKIAEGVATKEEYTKELAQRSEWRTRINKLEQLL